MVVTKVHKNLNKPGALRCSIITFCYHHALKDSEIPLNGCLPLFAPCSIAKKYQLTSLVKLPLTHMSFKAKFELHISWWKKQITKCYKLSCFHRIHLIAFSFLQAELSNVKRRKILKDDAIPTIFFYSQEVKNEERIRIIQKPVD